MKERETDNNEQFPNLEYAKYLAIDTTSSRLGIDDVSYELRNPDNKRKFEELLETLVLSCKGYWQIFDARTLCDALNTQLTRVLAEVRKGRTLLIFPGEGSQRVKKLINPDIVSGKDYLDLEITRTINNKYEKTKNVEITTRKNTVRKKLSQNVETCILIDDVLVTGSTATAVRNLVDPGERLRWYAATWMTLSPKQFSSRINGDSEGSGLTGYYKLVTALLYQGTSGIPATNSLSTLLRNNGKATEILNNYKRKYVDYPEIFDETLNRMRELVSIDNP